MSKIAISKISITNIEGGLPAHQANQTVTSWAAADALLHKWAYNAPKGGGYYKCDFVVEFSDGFTHRGRFDLQHISHGLPSLQSHVLTYFRFLAGTQKPAWMITHPKGDVYWEDSRKRYEADGTAEKARKFLATYHIGDDVPVPSLGDAE